MTGGLVRLLAFTTLFIAGPCWSDWYTDKQAIMGTEVRVTLWHSDPEYAVQAIDEVMTEMRRIDQLWNPENASSELYRVNQMAGNAAVEISAELAIVIDKALYYSRITGGAFDISFASVGQLYDYRAGIAPAREQRQQVLPAVNYRLVELDVEARLLRFGHPSLRIDLGGIAKGYAVDRARQLLVERQIQHASISAGGDTALLGNRRGRPWMVGIRNPRQEDNVALALPLEELALSTSGDYERFFIDPVSGQRIHHIINPRNGKSSSGVISASVMGPSGFDTDPLSTTVFVLGVDKGLALIDSLPGYDAVLIDAAGAVHYSNGLVE